MTLSILYGERQKHRGREYGLNQVWDDAHCKTALF